MSRRWLTALVLLASCGPVPPPVVTPPVPVPIPARTISLSVTADGVTLIDLAVGATLHVDDFGPAETSAQPGLLLFHLSAGIPCPYGADLSVNVPGYLQWTNATGGTRVVIPCDAELPAITLTKATPPIVGRRGPVRLQGRTLVDDDGPFLGLGASLFWALWGEQHDPERLDRNLAWLAERGVDYVRILGQVGGVSWSDRLINPRASEYWLTVDALLARLARHGLRAQVTIFGEAGLLSSAERTALVRRWAERAAATPERFLLLEIANEHWSTGLDDVDELRMLGAEASLRTTVLVALSATRTATASLMCAVYADSPADLVSMHYDRNRADGLWGSVRQPYGFLSEYDKTCKGRITDVATNNEPIGPESSVRADSAPLRLIMGAVNTWVTGDVSYVFHAGAGIRGGGAADINRTPKRFANWFEQPTAEATLAGIAAMRLRLPASLQNCEVTAAHRGTFPFSGFQEAADAGDLNRAYGALCTGTDVLVLNGLKRARTVTARRQIAFDLVDPLTGATLRTVVLLPGAVWTVTPRAHDGLGDGYVLIGTF